MKIWFFLALALLQSAAAQQTTIIGHVIASDGVWCDTTYSNCKEPDTKNIVGTMYPVRSQARLVRMGSLTGHEWLRIRSYFTGSVVVFDCSDAVDCKESLDLQRLYPDEGKPEQPSILAALLQVLRHLASTEPMVYERYRQGILRAEYKHGNIKDSVERLDARGLQLDQALDSLDAGDYALELCAIDRKASVRCPDDPQSQKYHWNRDHPKALLVHNLQPGLYRLYLCEKTSSGFIRTDNYASLLAVRPTRYIEMKQEFEGVVAVMKDWADQDVTIGNMSRMYLHEMAFRTNFGGNSPDLTHGTSISSPTATGKK